MNNESLNNVFTNTAGAIKNKLGTQDGISPSEFGSEINKIKEDKLFNTIYIGHNEPNPEKYKYWLDTNSEYKDYPISFSYKCGEIKLFDGFIDGDYTIDDVNYGDFYQNSSSYFNNYNNILQLKTKDYFYPSLSNQLASMTFVKLSEINTYNDDFIFNSLYKQTTQNSKNIDFSSLPNGGSSKQKYFSYINDNTNNIAICYKGSDNKLHFTILNIDTGVFSNNITFSLDNSNENLNGFYYNGTDIIISSQIYSGTWTYNTYRFEKSETSIIKVSKNSGLAQQCKNLGNGYILIPDNKVYDLNNDTIITLSTSYKDGLANALNALTGETYTYSAYFYSSSAGYHDDKLFMLNELLDSNNKPVYVLYYLSFNGTDLVYDIIQILNPSVNGLPLRYSVNNHFPISYNSNTNEFRSCLFNYFLLDNNGNEESLTYDNFHVKVYIISFNLSNSNILPEVNILIKYGYRYYDNTISGYKYVYIDTSNKIIIPLINGDFAEYNLKFYIQDNSSDNNEDIYLLIGNGYDGIGAKAIIDNQPTNIKFYRNNEWIDSLENTDEDVFTGH